MQEVHRLAWVPIHPFWLDLYLHRYREVTLGPPPRDFPRATTIRCFDTWLIGVRMYPRVVNAPPAGMGTPSPARSVPRSPVRGSAVGVGTTRGVFST